MKALLLVAIVCTAVSASPVKQNSSCGRRKQTTVDLEYKIVGGQDADKGEYPWMASVSWNGWGGVRSHYCGATLIGEEWILWAAHCAAVFDKSGDVVILGEYIRSKDDGTEKNFKVTEVITHTGYNDNTVENDISLMKLAEPATGFEPVCLPEAGVTFEGRALVTGWGTTSEGGRLADTLQEVVVPIVSDAQCGEWYGEGSIFPTMICAGEKGLDSCQGDSGGPMHCELETDGQLYHCGIVSWGEGCARDKRPGVYTEVSQFRDWIKEKS